jgi:hypothetical protein
MLAVCAGGLWGQTPKRAAADDASSTPSASYEQQDVHHTADELNALLEHYPPSLRNIFALDPSLLGNQAYLAAYPGLASFLRAHPEVERDPSFYFGNYRGENPTSSQRLWDKLLDGIAVFSGFGLAIGVLTWLIRTSLDYRRWNRLTKVQTDVHTKLLDRFTGSEELLSYIKSPAGAKFLESSPITLDAGPRSVGAPLGRILWSVQAGLVLAAGGVGLLVVSGQVPSDGASAFHAMGVFAIALGAGFMGSAIMSFFISQRLGLIDLARTPHVEPRTFPS